MKNHTMTSSVVLLLLSLSATWALPDPGSTIPVGYRKETPPEEQTKIRVKMDIHELEEVSDETLSFKMQVNIVQGP